MNREAYAETSVSHAKSKEQIERLLKSHGVIATQFTSLPSYAELSFIRKVQDQHFPYRITVKPKLDTRSRDTAAKLDKAERQVWRVVYWWLKSKFEAIDFGLVEFEQDFLPYALFQDTRTGTTKTVAEIFFERLAGRLGSPEDPFGGIKVLPPPGPSTEEPK